MIKLNKLTDYGFVLLTQFADSTPDSWHTARDLADVTGLPLPTVSKLLKIFSKGGLLSAHRGAHGGYSLSRGADRITVSDIIEIIDGPIAITDCVGSDSAETCAIEDHCPTRSHWFQITAKIRAALDDVTLAQLAQPLVAKNISPSGLDISTCHGGNCDTIPGDRCTCSGHLQHTTGETK